MRSNGEPVYNFCVTVDDATMTITHVISYSNGIFSGGWGFLTFGGNATPQSGVLIGKQSAHYFTRGFGITLFFPFGAIIRRRHRCG
ncbi:uncharacterized protein LOC128133059 [Lactuca sativa]|uniref:uncharacterized protein LOC128133059 n=1 Tax=Lactuca sativa TaxID=4236 RepID=UPI0022AF3B0F|nr:uncharacterized protein LOC128133059 [Lactuca sativa]